MQDARRTIRPGAAVLRSPPPLHCLQAFEAVARHRSLAKAAGELGLTGAALSQSIAALEDRLGVKLVRRIAPPVQLSDDGERYFHAVQAFVHRLGDGLYERFPVGRAQLRVSASQAMARLWLAPRLAQFARAHPRIDIVLTSTDRLEPIKQGGVDIGLRYGAADDDDLTVVPLWTDRHIAAASSRWATAARELSPAEMSRALPLIEHPVCSWREWLRDLDPAPPAVDPLLTCNDLQLAIEAARQGLGLVIAPSRMLAPTIASGDLHRVSRHSSPGRTYRAVLWRRHADRPPLQAFVRWLTEQAAAEQRGSPAASG